MPVYLLQENVRHSSVLPSGYVAVVGSTNYAGGLCMILNAETGELDPRFPDFIHVSPDPVFQVIML